MDKDVLQIGTNIVVIGSIFVGLSMILKNKTFEGIYLDASTAFFGAGILVLMAGSLIFIDSGNRSHYEIKNYELGGFIKFILFVGMLALISGFILIVF